MIEILLTDGEGQALIGKRYPSCAQLVVDGDYPEGARLAFRGGRGFLWVQVDQAVTPALMYLPEGGFDYRIPQGEARLAYPPGAFLGARHLVRAWLPTADELSRRRNLALNPAEIIAFPPFLILIGTGASYKFQTLMRRRAGSLRADKGWFP